MTISSNHPQEHQPAIEQVFKEFGEPGYFLSPHRSKIGKFVFKYLWILSVVMLILALILFIRHFALSTAWEYRRLIYQYHTLYQDGLISLEDFDELEWKILYRLEIENNYNDDPKDDSLFWMDDLTQYLEYFGDLYIPNLEDDLILDYPEEQFCYYSSLSDCYWEFYFEVMLGEGDLAEETAVDALGHLYEADFISEAELYRLYDDVVEKDAISETTSLEIQSHFVRGFLIEAQIVSEDDAGEKPPEDHRAAPDNTDRLAGEYEEPAEPHQVTKISSYVIHLLDRFLVEVATFTFIVVTIFWSRSFFNFSKQAPATFFQLASNGRIRKLAVDDEPLGFEENISLPWLKRQWILGKQLAKAKPRWQDFAVDLRDSASSPWLLLLFIFWMVFIVIVLNLAGMDFSQFTIDGEQSEIWLIAAIAVLAAYIYTVQFWILFVIARYLQMLPEVFDLDINFKHYDRSGGLGRIGNLSFRMAMIYMVPAIFIAGFLTYIIYRSTTDVVELVVVASRFSWLLSVIFLLVVILLVLANLTFFLPLWGIHKQMVLKKAEFEDNALLLTRPIDEQLEESVLSDEDQFTRIEELQKRLEAIELIYPSYLRLSTWPISSSAFISFLTTQVIPIISLVGTVISLFSN